MKKNKTSYTSILTLITYPIRYIFNFTKKIKSPTGEHEALDRELIFNISKQGKYTTNLPNIKQIKYLHKILSPKEKKSLKILMTVIALNLLTVIGYLSATNLDRVATYGGQYTEALIGHPQLINPILTNLNNVDDDLGALIFSGLLRYDENHILATDMASSYEISADQKKYTFHLKNNIFWHDMEPFNADDVIFTINVIQDPAYASTLSLNFDGIALEKIDDYTIAFTLSEPYAPFLDALTIGILPEHIWDNVPSNYFTLAEYNIKPVGTGPYKFDSLTKDKGGSVKSITLVVFENYFNEHPYISELTFKFYPEFQSAYEALINKNVQGISRIPRELYTKAMSNERLSTYVFTMPQYTALFFNLSKENPWKQYEMRSALARLTDKNALIQQLLPEQARPIESPMVTSHAPSRTDLIAPTFDTKEGVIILEKSGWSLNDEGVRVKNKTPLHITITTVNQFNNNEIAEFLKRSWSEYGIQTDIESIPFSEIKERLKNRNYELLLYGQSLGNDPDPYPFWHSTQRVHPGLNLSSLANKQIDELIESARMDNNPEKRLLAYSEFEQSLIHELPALFLYQPLYIYAVEKNIQNIKAHHISTPSDRFNSIENWYTKTRFSFTSK